jgi:hypothetical protein
MKITLALLTLLLLLPLGALAEDAPAEPEADAAAESENGYIDAAAGSSEEHFCYVTGEPWEPSPQRVEFVFADAGQLLRARVLNMGYYVYVISAMQKQGRAVSVRSISVVDYATVGTPNEHMIEVDRENANAWFVFTDKKVKDASAPYVFAFDTKDAAEEFSNKNGGRVKEYAGILTVLAQGLNDDSEKQPDDFGEQLMN